MKQNRKAEFDASNLNILVVDDEEHVGLFVETVLTNRGHNITRCMDGHKALELFKSDSDFFDLVITDQNMPRMSGIELSRKILKIRKDIPVVLSTGYGYEDIVDISRDIEIRVYLSKPLKPNELIDCIEACGY